MEITDAYLAAEEDVIRRCDVYAWRSGSKERYALVKGFASCFGQVLSIGSASYEPIYCRCSHALDISPITGQLLMGKGYNGQFIAGDCCALPFPDQSFECGLLCEVIEHLPTFSDVAAAVNELDRVCRSWLITTPFTPSPEPDHKRLLTFKDCAELVAGKRASVRHHLGFWCMWKSERDISFPFFSGPAGVQDGGVNV